MLCCLQSPWADPKAAYEQQATFSDVSSYPGQRRTYLKPCEIGLVSSDPSDNSHSYLSSQTQPVSYGSESRPKSKDGELVSGKLHTSQIDLNNVFATRRRYAENFLFIPVTVPNGVVGGQIMHVAHPDGSGRLIRAEVPKGLKPGNIFYVKALVGSTAPSSPIVTSSSIPSHTKPSNPPSPQRQSPVPLADAYPIYGEHIDVTCLPSPPASPPPFSECLEDDFPLRYTPASGLLPSPLTVGYQNGGLTSSSGMKTVKVVVPSGTVPGTTIHVQIPGENRLVAAQVPPNCREFHVQYDPQELTSPAASSSILNSPAMYQHHSYRPPPVPSSPAAASDYAPSTSTCHDTKLLSVKVPKGTRAGSTLHVQVPGEPGRLLSARVPPGNVREFHISYLPRSAAGPIATSATRPLVGNWGSAVLPVAGGVATGLAGAMVYDHFAHHYNN